MYNRMELLSYDHNNALSPKAEDLFVKYDDAVKAEWQRTMNEMMLGNWSVSVDSDCMRYQTMKQNQNEKNKYGFHILDVERIIRNGPATIVIWKDGTKTIVKRRDDEPDDPYAAFCAGLAIRIYGNNSKLKKMIEKKTVQQKKKALEVGS